MNNFRKKFEDIKSVREQCNAFCNVFYDIDEKAGRKQMEQFKPRIKTLMENLIWVMENPEIFDNPSVFGTLCAIHFSTPADDIITLRVGNVPLYLKRDYGYTLCVDNQQMTCQPCYIEWLYKQKSDDVSFVYNTGLLDDKDAYKSSIQIYSESLRTFIENFSNWEIEIEENLETAIKCVEKDNIKFREVRIYNLGELTGIRITEEEATAKVAFDMSPANISTQTLHLEAYLLYDITNDTKNIPTVAIIDDIRSMSIKDKGLLSDMLQQILDNYAWMFEKYFEKLKELAKNLK